MTLDRTKSLLGTQPDASDPMALLIVVIEAAIELVSLDGNDFAWSSWADRDAAVQELNALLALVRDGTLPPRLSISTLFAPTGPIQELSMNSGWAEPFLRLAEHFDAADNALWALEN